MSEIITVHLDQKPIYDIVIEKDFSQLGTAFSRLNVTGRKICIVTDSNVGPLYAKAVQEVLETTGNQIFVYTFAAGEESKNLNTVQDLYEFLIENHFDRKDMLAALGGGVVGDLTGFTAATYLRGISFIQIRLPFWLRLTPASAARPVWICVLIKIWSAHSISQSLYT